MKKQNKTQNQIDNIQKVGPNGFRTEYTKEGDLVEILGDEGNERQLLLRRNNNAIQAAYKELKQTLFTFEHALLKGRLEQTYDLDNPIFNNFERGVLYGRLEALAWVQGSDWDTANDVWD